MLCTLYFTEAISDSVHRTAVYCIVFLKSYVLILHVFVFKLMGNPTVINERNGCFGYPVFLSIGIKLFVPN